MQQNGQRVMRWKQRGAGAFVRDERVYAGSY